MEGKTPGTEEERLERGSSGPQAEPFDAVDDDDDVETMAAESERYSSASECVRTDTGLQDRQVVLSPLVFICGDKTRVQHI